VTEEGNVDLEIFCELNEVKKWLLEVEEDGERRISWDRRAGTGMGTEEKDLIRREHTRVRDFVLVASGLMFKYVL